MRAFAKHLGLNQSFLVKLIKGERRLTEVTQQRIAAALGLRTQNSMPSDFYHNLNEDVFEVLSDSIHFGVLEFIKINKGKITLKSVAEAFAVSLLQAEDALDRLTRVGFIQRSGKSYKILKPNNNWMNPSQTSSARQKMQTSVMENAVIAAKTLPFEQRHHASLTVACSEKLIPEIKKRINHFIDEIDVLIENEGDPTAVYQIAIGFFPITKPGVKNEK